MSKARGTNNEAETGVTDPYEVLQLRPNAHPLIVMRTFRVLASMYHPDNKQTGDRVKFEQVVNAYRTLSDPVSRAAFETAEPPRDAVADGPSAPAAPRRRAAPNDERRLRLLILQTLYNTRRSSLTQPGLTLRVLVDMTDSSFDEVQFSIWYLRGKKLIEIGDNDEVAITVTGVDYVEDNTAAMDEMLSLPEARGAIDAGGGSSAGS